MASTTRPTAGEWGLGRAFGGACQLRRASVQGTGLVAAKPSMYDPREPQLQLIEHTQNCPFPCLPCSPLTCRLSARSAKIYETSTETLFVGRQDAMQRGTLVPLRDFMAGKDASQMTALEVAAGTGRFATCAAGRGGEGRGPLVGLLRRVGQESEGTGEQLASYNLGRAMPRQALGLQALGNVPTRSCSLCWSPITGL